MTHLKFNIAPERLPSQNENNLPTILFQGRAVKLREGVIIYPSFECLTSMVHMFFFRSYTPEFCTCGAFNSLEVEEFFRSFSCLSW